MSNISHIAKIV